MSQNLSLGRPPSNSNCHQSNNKYDTQMDALSDDEEIPPQQPNPPKSTPINQSTQQLPNYSKENKVSSPNVSLHSHFEDKETDQIEASNELKEEEEDIVQASGINEKAEALSTSKLGKLLKLPESNKRKPKLFQPSQIETFYSDILEMRDSTFKIDSNVDDYLAEAVETLVQSILNKSAGGSLNKEKLESILLANGNNIGRTFFSRTDFHS